MVVLRRYDDQRVGLAHLGGKVGLLNNYFLEREIEQEQKKAEYVLKPAAWMVLVGVPAKPTVVTFQGPRNLTIKPEV